MRVSFLFYTLIFSIVGVSAQTVEIDLNAAKLTQQIDASLQEASRNGESPVAHVSLPWFEGEQLAVDLKEASQFAPALQAQYPDIRSYRVVTPDGSRHGRLNTSPRGVFMVLLGGDGPVGILHENEDLVPSHKLERIDLDAQYAAIACEVEANENDKEQGEASRIQANSCFQLGATLRKYRMALGCTGEFATNNGGTTASVNTAYNNRLAELNAIFEVDASVTFELIATNNTLMNFDASTDPFSDPSNSVSSLDETELFIEANIDNADYDIGHCIHDVVGGGSASGRAGVGVVCVTGLKSRGWSTVFNGSSLAIMQHEVGHQFSCRHTNFGCSSSGAQRYEVGRGNTIMNPGTIPSCIGLNSENSISPISSIYFHVGSIASLENHIASTATCFTPVVSGNSAPSSDASASGGNTIPANTPFKLEGGGSDPDGGTLNYCWEQYDTDGTSTGFPTATANSTIAPMFRSNAPSTESDRYFPKLSTILSGVAPDGTDGELMTNATRTMTFRLTARDGSTGIACDETSVSVVNTGAPFQITSQNVATSLTADGTSTATVTWDVAGTTANGINTANVDILFSDNGGATFSFAIASATANDGSHTFTIPAFATTNGRIMVRGAGNIFLDINDAPITITVGGTCAAREISISPSAAVTAEVGDASLNLNLSPDWGTQLSNPFNITISGSSSSGLSVLEDADTAGPVDCVTKNFGGRYEQLEVFAGSNTSYTFSSSAAFFQSATLFESSFQGDCTNYLAATTKATSSNPSTLSAVVPATAVALNTSTPYVLAGFGIGSTGAISVSYTGGNLFDGIPDPGASYFYTYGIINDATGNIVAFDASADLSNATNFPAGTYTVFGASVETGTTLSIYEGGTKAAFVNAAAVQTICARVSSNDVTVTITAAPLPVELLSFAATPTKNSVDLSWKVATEFDLYGYRIEHRSEAGDWNSIATIEARDLSLYEYSHFNIAPGNHYYKLTSIDDDGSQAESDIVAVTLKGSAESLQVYPNPLVRGSGTLQLNSWGITEQVKVQILDLNGRLVRAWKMQVESASVSTTELSLTDLAAGSYLIEVRGETQVEQALIRL